ncbi:MAG: hypothetical protein KDI83_01890 [Gammaproteobacteria bacterium]|nr:hypothetical protein [Gammaproteobacteria bacterium]MCP5417706.1 hypothetical protein [Chromatiaceae bacterium]
MAEIKQPAPIKPIWPMRREPQSSNRNVVPSDAEGRERRRRQDDRERKRPVIDEYV